MFWGGAGGGGGAEYFNSLARYWPPSQKSMGGIISHYRFWPKSSPVYSRAQVDPYVLWKYPIWLKVLNLCPWTKKQTYGYEYKRPDCHVTFLAGGGGGGEGWSTRVMQWEFYLNLLLKCYNKIASRLAQRLIETMRNLSSPSTEKILSKVVQYDNALWRNLTYLVCKYQTNDLSDQFIYLVGAFTSLSTLYRSYHNG